MQAKPELTDREAAEVTHMVLSTYIGPAVGSTTSKPSKARVWGCRTNGRNRAVCQGTVRHGVVRCKGTFLIVKYPKGYGAWPRRMECVAD